MIADLLRRRNSKGIPHSMLETFFTDGSSIKETECSWGSISKEKRVRYFGENKVVFVCVFPVEKIVVTFGEMKEEILSRGCEMYQAIRSNIVVGSSPEILGRCVGLVKDNEVIEEIFLNGKQNEVMGMRK